MVVLDFLFLKVDVQVWSIFVRTRSDELGVRKPYIVLLDTTPTLLGWTDS